MALTIEVIKTYGTGARVIVTDSFQKQSVLLDLEQQKELITKLLVNLYGPDNVHIFVESGEIALIRKH